MTDAERAVIDAAKHYVEQHSQPQRSNEPLVRTTHALHDAVRALVDEEAAQVTMSD